MNALLNLNTTIVLGASVIFFTFIALFRKKKIVDVIPWAMPMGMTLIGLQKVLYAIQLMATEKLEICENLADIHVQITVGLYVCAILAAASISGIVKQAWRQSKD